VIPDGSTVLGRGPRRVVPGRVAIRKRRPDDVLLALAGGAVGFGLILLLWWFASVRLGPARLPTPWEVAGSFFPLLWSSTALTAQGGSAGIADALIYTTLHVLLGVACGAAVGILVGVAMGTIRLLNDLLTKVVEIVRTIPPLAAIPFFLVWFGVSATGRTLLLAFYTAVIVLIATRAAVRYTDPIFSSFASTLGAGRLRQLRTIVIPAVIPRIIGGIRVALGLSWGLQIVAELLGSQSGVGRVIVLYENVQAIKEIMITVIWISIIAYVVDKVYILLTGYLTRWTPTKA
jgi:ABC-type nitrate/sulfonate/bicarbonate transport system permease component